MLLKLYDLVGLWNGLIFGWWVANSLEIVVAEGSVSEN